MRRFVDISVPRNIAPALNGAPGAIVYNVDDLKEVVSANKEARAAAVAEAELLLADEQLAFEAWRDSLETVPTIKALRGKAETIRAVELEKTLNKLGDGLTNKQKKVGGAGGLVARRLRRVVHACGWLGRFGADAASPSGPSLHSPLPAACPSPRLPAGD